MLVELMGSPVPFSCEPPFIWLPLTARVTFQNLLAGPDANGKFPIDISER